MELPHRNESDLQTFASTQRSTCPVLSLPAARRDRGADMATAAP